MTPVGGIPFVPAIMGVIIVLVGLAVTARDDLLAIGGVIASVGALGAVGYWMFS